MGLNVPRLGLVLAQALALALAMLAVAAALVLGSGRHREQDAAAALAPTPPSRPPGQVGAQPGSRSKRRGQRPFGSRRPRPRAPTSDEVAASMVLLAVALQSGCGVVEAIEQVAAVAASAPAGDLSVVAAALRWGLDEERAWAEADPLSWFELGLALL